MFDRIWSEGDAPDPFVQVAFAKAVHEFVVYVKNSPLDEEMDVILKSLWSWIYQGNLHCFDNVEAARLLSKAGKLFLMISSEDHSRQGRRNLKEFLDRCTDIIRAADIGAKVWQSEGDSDGPPPLVDANIMGLVAHSGPA